LSVGRSFAFEALPKHLEFTLFLQLQLAREFQIAEWVEPAFRSLVNQPLENIGPDQAAQMGGLPYYVLLQTKRLIDAHVHNITFIPPPVYNCFLCLATGRSDEVWKRAWWAGFAKHILHPDSPLSGSEAIRVLNDAQIPDMCEHCLRNTVDSIWEANPFEELELMTRDGIGQVVEWITGKPIVSAYLEAQEVRMQIEMEAYMA
jgi:hypothetical protein